jgi:predicted transcriptional regulator
LLHCVKARFGALSLGSRYAWTASVGLGQSCKMATVRRTLELDADIDARLSALAAAKGKDASAVGTDALVLLGSVVELEGLDIEEDQRRLAEFEETGQAVLLVDVKAWVDSWGTEQTLTPPKPTKLR